MSRWLTSFAVLALLACLGSCAKVKPPAIPKWTAPVLDEAQVIPAADEERMNQFVKVLEQRTGAQIAVYTVATLAGQDAAMLATELAEQWGVGNREKDNGVLVLIAPADRKDFTATGRGVEGALPDSLVGSLRRDVLVPALQSGDYGGGLRQYLYELGVRIAAEDEKEPGELTKDFAGLLGVKGAAPTAVGGKPKSKQRRKQHWSNWLVLAFILMMMIGGGLRGRRRYGFWGAMWMAGMAGRSGHGRSSGGFGGGFGGGGGSFGGGGAGGSW